MSWWVETNEYLDPIFALLGKAGAAFGVIYGIYKWVRKKINSGRNFRNLSPEEREVFYQVYSKISSARGLVLREGRVLEEAQKLYWEARDQARLNLPEKIASYTENIRETASKAYSINQTYLYPHNLQGLPVGEERSKKVDEHGDLIAKLVDDNPSNIFAPYMRIKLT